MDYKWVPLQGFPRTEACVAGDFLYLRDSMTKKLIRHGISMNDSRVFALRDTSGATQVLSEDFIKSGLVGPQAHQLPMSENLTSLSEGNPDEPAPTSSRPSVNVEALRAKIDLARDAARDATLSQDELARILGVSRYWVRKALGS